jgi:hypothetical protein
MANGNQYKVTLMKNLLTTIIIFILTGVVFAVSLRGHLGHPLANELNTAHWITEGPFELSPERGRFVITYSLLENKSFHFAPSIARFATPDLGYRNGKYVSLFFPGTSFIIMPGYILGAVFNATQLGTYATIALFAVLNLLLIRAIAKVFIQSDAVATLCGLLFTFGTPAFAYGVSLYQHHISTFVLLLAVYFCVKFRGWKSIVLVSICFGLGAVIDYPNLILLLPTMIFAFLKSFSIKETVQAISLKVKPLYLLCFITAIIPLTFLLWFNYQSYGDPPQLPGTVASVRAIGLDGKPENAAVDKKDLEKYFNQEETEKSVIGFFQTRGLINGLYLQLISPDRGMLFFAPVVLLGLIGLFTTSDPRRTLLLGIVAANLTLYAMWGDPWGGWAFGSRYLIPASAILAVGSAFLFKQVQKNTLVLLVIGILAAYSIAVNTAGALTSNANPPQVEVLSLEKLSGRQEKYTVERNLDQLKDNHSKSFVFETYVKDHLSAWNFYLVLVGIITASTIGLLGFIRFAPKYEDNNQ